MAEMQTGPQRRDTEICVNLGPTTVLRLSQNRSQGSSTGWLVWPVAIDLCKYLMSQPELVKDKKVLELGAGTGAVGITCGLIGSNSVCISDLPECIPILNANLKSNLALVSPRTKMSVDTVRWGNKADIDLAVKDHGGFDAIVGSDIIFHQPEEVLSALVRTICEASNFATKVLIAYEDRVGMIEDEEFFFEPMRSHFQSLETVDLGCDRTLFIFSGFIA